MKNIRLTHSMLLGLALTLASGCTHLTKMPAQTMALPQGQKLPHTAALVLNKDLADYKHEFHLMGDTWVYPFGPALEDNARKVTGQCFHQVKEFSSEAAALQETSADLILIPRAVKADQSVPVWAWEKLNFTLVVEWTAKDRASQNTVWLKTITAEASEKGGNAFTGSHHQRILMQKLLDDLSLKTYNAFQEAPELRGNQP